MDPLIFCCRQGLKMAFHLNQKECRICANESGNQLYEAREMFFGTRDPFTYIECASCGTIQIQDVPDLAPWQRIEKQDRISLSLTIACRCLTAMRAVIRSNLLSRETSSRFSDEKAGSAPNVRTQNCTGPAFKSHAVISASEKRCRRNLITRPLPQGRSRTVRTSVKFARSSASSMH